MSDARPSDPDRELRWLRRLRDLTHRLARERERRRLLPGILDAAIELAEAERGYLVLVTPRPGARPKLKVEVARGFDQEALQGAAGKVSRTVVERVLEQGRGVVTTREEDRDLRDVTSVADRRVLAILCAPLRLRGEVRGVLYLDHRFRPDAFVEADLPLVEAFADQAALALEEAERAPPAAPTAGAPPGGAAPAALATSGAGDADADDPSAGPTLPPGTTRLGALIGGSAPMRALYARLERAARTRAPVLITGESGTGKELVARELHARGAAAGEPFLSESCAALAEGVLESELFGHRRGAFTGADADRRGLFEQAGRGTLFLDEVGETSPAMQAKLLRVLQEGRVRPVGGDALVPVACRVVAATHRDLRALVAAGAFREDLYYRLDVLRLHVPPLRERPEDLPLLVEHLLAREAGRPLEVTPAALELLAAHGWPGNVRELENECRRLAALGLERVRARDLSPEVGRGEGLVRAGGDYAGKTLGQVEREMVALALRESGGNKARAARALGIPKTTLYHLIARYGLDPAP